MLVENLKSKNGKKIVSGTDSPSEETLNKGLELIQIPYLRGLFRGLINSPLI